jgi:hypothetical protein
MIAMLSQQPEVAVAFTIRHKFKWTLASLQRLYALAGVPFRLYVVDAVYPPEVRSAIDEFLADKTNVVRLTVRRFLYPNESLNLALSGISERYVFLLQNDVLISRDALATALATAKRLDCDVVSPEVLDNAAGAPTAHHESSAALVIRERPDGLWVEADSSPERRNGYRRLHLFEMHCLLIRADALRAAGPLAPFNVHEHVDVALAWWRQGRSVYLDEASRVLVMDTPPEPLRVYEIPYYRFRWDWTRARQSQDYIREKWRMANLFDVKPFIELKHSALRPEAIVSDYGSALEADQWPAEISA